MCGHVSSDSQGLAASLPCKYRKVSANQQARDRDRLNKYNTHSKHTHTQTHDNPTPLTPKDIFTNATKRRKLDDMSPELIRRSTTEDSVLETFIDSPCAINRSCEDVDDHVLLPASPLTTHPPITIYGPLPMSKTDIVFEEVKITTPPDTFTVSENIVENMEYCSATTNPDVTIHHTLIECKLEPLPLHAQKPQAKSAAPTTINQILCPNCDTPMTPNHECENECAPNPNTMSSDPSPPPPYPAELADPPTTAEGWNNVLHDPDFQRRMNAYCESPNSDCTIQ